MTMMKYGAIACLLHAVSYFAPLIYLFWGPPEGVGLSSYDFADFLYGPVWGATLVAATFALRERFGERAPRRMTLALLMATLAAGASVSVAFIRSTNRNYLAARPELNPVMGDTLLTAWTTIVTGMIETQFHFLAWTMVLIGAAFWPSRAQERVLSMLYLTGGIIGLLGFLLHAGNPLAALFGLMLSILLGIWLWKEQPTKASFPETYVS